MTATTANVAVLVVSVLRRSTGILVPPRMSSRARSKFYSGRNNRSDSRGREVASMQTILAAWVLLVERA